MDEGGQKMMRNLKKKKKKSENRLERHLKQHKCLSLGHRVCISKELFFIHSGRVLIFSILQI